jgi:hypothetical protein
MMKRLHTAPTPPLPLAAAPRGARARRPAPRPPPPRAAAATAPPPLADAPPRGAGAAPHAPRWEPHAHFPLRQEMLRCASAADLAALLAAHAGALSPADVAAAWHVAAQRRLLTLARSGERGEAALAEALLALVDGAVDGMDPTALSTAAWALAATGADAGGARLAALLARALPRVTDFRPPELGVLLWAAASHPELPAAARARPFSALAALVAGGMSLARFSAGDLSVLVWAMGRAGYRCDDLLDAAEGEAAAKLGALAPPDAARLLHGFAMLRRRPRRLVALLAEAGAPPGALDAHAAEDVALLLVSLGKLGMEPGKDFLRTAAARAAALVPPTRRLFKSTAGRQELDPGAQLHPRHVAHLLWAFARLDGRIAERSFVARALAHLAAAPELYAAEDVGAALWACAEMGVDPPPAALEAAARRLARLAAAEDPATLARGLAAAAALAARRPPGAAAGAALAALARGAAARLAAPGAAEALAPAELAAALAALGTLEAAPVLPAPVAARLQAAAAAAAPAFAPRALPKLAWAFARLGWREPATLDALAAAAAAGMALIPADGVVQLAWAAAAAERPQPALAAALARAAGARLGAYPPRDKARLAWAFAALARRAAPGAGAAAEFLERLLRSVEPAEVSDLDAVSVSALLWACARVAAPPARLLAAAAATVAAGAGGYSREQLRLARAVLERHGGRGSAALEVIARHAAAAAPAPRR